MGRATNTKEAKSQTTIFSFWASLARQPPVSTPSGVRQKTRKEVPSSSYFAEEIRYAQLRASLASLVVFVILSLFCRPPPVWFFLLSLFASRKHIVYDMIFIGKDWVQTIPCTCKTYIKEREQGQFEIPNKFAHEIGIHKHYANQNTQIYNNIKPLVII